MLRDFFTLLFAPLRVSFFEMADKSFASLLNHSEQAGNYQKTNIMSTLGGCISALYTLKREFVRVSSPNKWIRFLQKTLNGELVKWN